MSALEITLVVLLGAQQAFYMFQVQRLIDKLMSRNYFEFKQAEQPIIQRKPTVDQSPDEDIGSLAEFGA